MLWIRSYCQRLFLEIAKIYGFMRSNLFARVPMRNELVIICRRYPKPQISMISTTDCIPGTTLSAQASAASTASFGGHSFCGTQAIFWPKAGTVSGLPRRGC
jgi:hypothetical protein